VPGWLFELVFDYDEGHYAELEPDADGRRYVRASTQPAGSWSVRRDPFSTYRPAFELRTYRLCRRVLGAFRRGDGLDFAFWT
jgi:Salmonella virulence plasmid 65kDa B protein